MPIAIRQARPEDAAAIAEFNRLLAWDTEGKTLDAERLRRGVEAMLADPHKGWYFVAEDAGQVVGQLAVTFEWSDWRNGWFWWIQSVYVAASARRRGVLRSLFQHVEASAKSAGDVIGLRLYVEENNRDAQEVYRRLGWTPAGYHVLECDPSALR